MPRPHPSYSRFRQAVFGLLAPLQHAASHTAAVAAAVRSSDPAAGDPGIHPYVGPIPAQDNAVDTAWARRYAVQLMYENPACNDLITGKFTQKTVSILRTISIFDATAPTQPAIREGGGLLPWLDHG